MIRRRLVATATATLAVALVALTMGFYTALSWRLESDADGVLRARAEAAAATVTTFRGRLRVNETHFDEVLDSGVWVFDAAGVPVSAPPVPGPLDPLARRLSSVSRSTFRNVGDDLRMLAIPLHGPATPDAIVVAALSLIPYEHAERTALIGALVLDVLVLGLSALFVRRAVTQALRPVAQMTAQAARWSERDLDRRFGLGSPRDELTGLASTLDSLLGRLSAALRHEQRVTAEIAHELRTPLAQLRLETEVALRRDRSAAEFQAVLRQVLDGTDRMAAALDTLIGLARRSIDPSAGTAAAVDVAADARRACRARGREIQLDLECAAGLTVGCDHEVVLRMLQPLLDNALRYGRSAALLRVSRSENDVVFAIVDDGPGFAAGELETVLGPGAQGRAAAPGEGAGLGLALARRLAEAAGGVLTPKVSQGGLIELRLPVA
ncbi:Signal transduction histidine kinase [Streptosporangium subroseum]|uniref:histidine kinase n=1 Tax=Streptosporangium subroseum TaxID=106412 RepID=A0A239LVF7_9ACTN|nr:ATP-binding protein [Streptosporangium subroseum]SNT33604.1 Signal transduction histidine kinase [Streptosporangium subroseum]